MHIQRSMMTFLILKLKGGEGIVMRKIGSMYTCGRSTDLLKVKVCFLFLHLQYWSHTEKTRWHRISRTWFKRWFDFLEIVCYSNWSKLELIVLNRPQGDVFQIPKHHSPFPIHKGDIITIAYNSFKRRQIPVDLVIVCKRNDLLWEDIVINNTKKQAPQNCM